MSTTTTTTTFAPGKLVLTGAYAVLEGAPAIAVAVSRGAYADATRVAAKPTPEVLAALGKDEAAPEVDASSMFDGDRKLGLGASAAILVSSLAAIAAARAPGGEDLASEDVRAAIFTRARNAHRAAQGGGSGIDIAASVHGGAIHYVMEASVPVRAVALPAGVNVYVFASATSAKTSDLRAIITRLKSERPDVHRACMKSLVTIAEEAAVAIEHGDAKGFIESHRRTARALAALGEAAGYAIVPAGFQDLESIARDEADASFAVSGAGGGDVAVWIGNAAAPTPRFLERALALNLRFLDDITIDVMGVRAHHPIAVTNTNTNTNTNNNSARPDRREDLHTS
jgi:phosphomevalonate kinase